MKECELCHVLTCQLQQELVPTINGYTPKMICDACEIKIIQRVLKKFK